jgi:hypothetical protein
MSLEKPPRLHKGESAALMQEIMTKWRSTPLAQAVHLAGYAMTLHDKQPSAAWRASLDLLHQSTFLPFA